MFKKCLPLTRSAKEAKLECLGLLDQVAYKGRDEGWAKEAKLESLGLPNHVAYNKIGGGGEASSPKVG